ncbi:hypothetical protein P692DRAFT_201867904 [Suillus brevipes Sb2]|nr:hypothetical protein P692DRAFT_201867904 [Suillus brevipes Sb2]
MHSTSKPVCPFYNQEPGAPLPFPPMLTDQLEFYLPELTPLSRLFLIPKPPGKPGQPGCGGYTLYNVLDWSPKSYVKFKKFIHHVIEDHLDTTKSASSRSPTSTSAQVSVLADSDSGGATATSVVAASIDGYDYDDGQSLLPENGAPFAFILYADKTHLLTAGTVKAYPVIARYGNLPVNIRNVDGPGGGRLVGWLPIVPEDSDEDGKLSYTNLKRVVWHESFSILLITIMVLSATGFAHDEWSMFVCDGTNTGLNSACPCPICLVPREELTDHLTTYPKRTIKDAQDHVELWSRDHIAGEAELKKLSLRPIKNAFWRVKLYHKGKFGDHLFDEFKKHVKALGRAAEKKVDEQFDAFPQWQNLNHFDRVTNIFFTDGNKFQDISRQIVYAAQNVLTRAEDEAGYALLKCIVSYLHIDMYVSLDVHTESTLAAGEAEILVFQKLLDEYIEALGNDMTKNWNFPKAHASKHMFTSCLCSSTQLAARS